MRNKLRKKVQKEINRSTRALNKNIENDSLWRGRFVVKQLKHHWHEYEDKSGGEIVVLVQFRDKKTNITTNHWYDNYSIEWKMWVDMNNFITKNCYEYTWKNRDELYADKTDYRSWK